MSSSLICLCLTTLFLHLGMKQKFELLHCLTISPIFTAITFSYILYHKKLLFSMKQELKFRYFL